MTMTLCETNTTFMPQIFHVLAPFPRLAFRQIVDDRHHIL